MKNLILAIESSCDDSSIAIIDKNTLECKFHKKISQELEHSIYGGVVPELAARLHSEALPKILKQCKEHFKNLCA
ncbi:tRNA (adenosine(37)-N6)-threonylcarbamoyltransferase complex transferase subunit TsaD, partial [Campylobacter coli]|nr:tRNA (adenosine(37)-N6)-threonylcarbamoyltransferase complex transferase subunit TsaD [Campylobacter coli]